MSNCYCVENYTVEIYQCAIEYELHTYYIGCSRKLLNLHILTTKVPNCHSGNVVKLIIKTKTE